jgi:O-antigen/teichoic acid export membrane protein
MYQGKRVGTWSGCGIRRTLDPVVRIQGIVKKPFVASSLNTVSLLIQVVGRAAFALYIPLLASPDQVGRYSYLSWLLNITIAGSTLGIPYAAQRFLPGIQDPTARKDVETFLLRLTLCFFCGALLILGGLTLMGTAAAAYVGLPLSLIVVGAGAGTFTTVQCSIRRGRQEFVPIIVGELLSQVVRFLALFIAGRSLAELTGVHLILMETLYWLTMGAYSFWSNRPALFRERGGGREDNAILQYIASVAILWVLDMLVLQRLEVAFLTEWSTAADAGFFNLATQLSVAVTIAPIAACSALLPTFAHLRASDPAGLKNLFSKVSTLAWILMFPIVGFAMIAGPIAIRMAYGPAYTAAGTILPALLLARGLVMVNTTNSTLLYAIGDRRQLLLLGGVNVATSLILDATLVWWWKLTGAAAAALLIQIAVISVTMVLTRNQRNSNPPVIGLVGGGIALIVTHYVLSLGHELVAAVMFLLILAGTCMVDPTIPRTVSATVLHIRRLRKS